jgi:hypothetical protein
MKSTISSEGITLLAEWTFIRMAIISIILDCNKESSVTWKYWKINLHTKPPIISYPRFSRRWNERLVYAGVGDPASLIESIIMLNPNNKWEQYIFQQYLIKLVLVVTSVIFMTHSVGSQDLQHKIVDSRLHTPFTFSTGERDEMNEKY